jgi:hypothetical protein
VNAKNKKGPRKRAFALAREVFRDPQLRLIVVGTTLAVVIIPSVLEIWLSTKHVREFPWLDGFSIGFILASFLAIVLYGVRVVSGANPYLIGSLAEDWTDQELRKLGAQWSHFRNVPFDEGWGDSTYEVDIDHIAIGPYGVAVLETKFSTAEINLSARRIGQPAVDASDQALRNAGRVKALLCRDAPWAPIRPVVVYWGPNVAAPENHVRRIEGVRLVAGTDASGWLPKLSEHRNLTDDQVSAIVEKFEQYLHSREVRN